MRSEQRIECGKLEPADIQLARVFLRRNEATNVRAPKGYAAEPRIDANGNVRFQRLPSRLDVARPQERREPLHARATIPVESIDSLVRPVHALAFEVHAIARQARRRIESVALIRP